jgi:hypothetical protein
MWSRTTNYSSNEDGDSVNNYSSDEDDDSALSSEPFSSVPESPNDSYGEETEHDKEEDDESSYLQKTGDIYARKFTLIRKYEKKLNMIFESYYDSKAK